MLISTCSLVTLDLQLTPAWHPIQTTILYPMLQNVSTLVLHLILATAITTAVVMRLMEATLQSHLTLEMSWATEVLPL